MKFTKEEFSEELKNRLTNNGKKKLAQSDRTFNASVERIYKRLEKREDDETELDDAVADYLPDFEEIEGNMRKDNASFVKDWQKKHPEKDDDDPDDDDPDDVDPDDKPDKKKGKRGKGKGGDDAMSKILAKLDALEKKQNERDKAEKIADKRKELKSALKKDGVEDTEWIDNYIKKLNITEETDIDEEKDDALKLYNKSNANTPPYQTPGAGGGKGGNDFDLSDLKPKK